MPSVPSNIYSVLMEVSRYLFALLGVLALLAALAWIMTENRAHKERLRSLPAAGTIGELVVLSGGPELSPQTWFPVPREGVLGSFRSCDLVVPCPGIKARHLDFVWQDGLGLLVRPRSGCQIQVNNALLDCHSDAASYPLTHGGFLRVGDAVLRLQVFKALDHTAAETVVQSAEPAGSVPANEYPSQLPVYDPGAVSVFTPVKEIPEPAFSAPADTAFVPSDPVSQPSVPSSAPAAAHPPRRSDRWREEWGE